MLVMLSNAFTASVPVYTLCKSFAQYTVIVVIVMIYCSEREREREIIVYVLKYFYSSSSNIIFSKS